MYELIFWMCLTDGPKCEMYNSVKNMVFMWPDEDHRGMRTGLEGNLRNP